MSPIKITVLRQTVYEDLIKLYENALEEPCCMEVGKVYTIHDAQKPDDFCASAWETLRPFVLALAAGERGLFDGWMKDPRSVLISCNDGFRPVSFYVEATDEE